MLCFLQIDGKALHQQKDNDALLWWGGTKPAVSPRYVCTVPNTFLDVKIHMTMKLLLVDF